MQLWLVNDFERVAAGKKPDSSAAKSIQHLRSQDETANAIGCEACVDFVLFSERNALWTLKSILFREGYGISGTVS